MSGKGKVFILTAEECDDIAYLIRRAHRIDDAMERLNAWADYLTGVRSDSPTDDSHKDREHD